MFEWLKIFLEWPKFGINNISELGTYIKEKWFKFDYFPNCPYCCCLSYSKNPKNYLFANKKELN